MALALFLFPLMCFAYWKALNTIAPPYAIDHKKEALKFCSGFSRHSGGDDATGMNPVDDPTNTAMMMDMGEL